MHRDVKPSNIVYLNGEKDNKGYKIFLIDFGLAKIFTNDEEVQNENVGTELYKAP
jgi:serine/threonine protein kinase